MNDRRQNANILQVSPQAIPIVEKRKGIIITGRMNVCPFGHMTLIGKLTM
jgi:hypothetical protein